jgi:hypothetical protein
MKKISSNKSSEVSIDTNGTTPVGSAATSHLAVAPPTPVSPPGAIPPEETAPPTPVGWRPSKPTVKRGFRGLRLKGDQITNATSAATELQASPTYAADFGATAPSPTALAYTLTNASAWREHWAAADKWAQYCSEQRIAWENEAMGQMSTLKPTFDYAVSRAPDLATKYRATARFMDTTSAIGKRAAASRKASESEKKKAAKAAPVATATVTQAAAKTLN